MFNLDDCIASITSRSAKILADCLEKRLNKYNITRSQWMALYYVSRNNMITQKQLADKMFIKEPTVVRMLDKMEAMGWLTRISSESDKRIKSLKLTVKGQEIETAMLEVADKFREDVIKDLSLEELENYKYVLNKMLSNIENG